MFSSGVPKIKLSKNFQDVCLKIGECKSREEEQQIVGKWVVTVRESLLKPSISISELYENVIALIHLNLLGYNTEFGEIHAVNLTQDSQMMTKALGYLACCALLDSKSDLLILIINSTQRDLSPTSPPTAWALALSAICHLVTADLIPPIINYVGLALQHSVPLVRQKAIMCIHSFIHKDPSCVIEFFPELIRLLNDDDLSVVNAVVNTFNKLLDCQMNIRQICETAPTVAQIINRIQNCQCPIEYYHQQVMAPFILVNLYRLLQKMGPSIPEIGPQVAPLITNTLQNFTTERTSLTMCLYEAVRTCISLNLREIPQLCGAISMFMSTRDQNTRYIGLGMLTNLPSFADEFQTIILDCLEHPDPTVALRTLELLHAMANENNAQIIVVNMLQYFQRSKNQHTRIELADRITSIASRFAPSPIWFARTMEQLFALGGNQINSSVAFQVMHLVEEQCDDEVRKSIVNLYIDVATSGRKLSDVFVMVIARIIGNYAELSDEYELSYIALLLCDLADEYQASRDWVLTALMQVIPKLEGDVPQPVLDLFENYKNSGQIIVQELAYEATSLINGHVDVLGECIDPEEVQFDEELSFLDSFVEDAVANHNCPQYIPIDDRDVDFVPDPKKQIKFVAYQTQTAANTEVISSSQQDEYDASPGGLNTAGVASVWGEDGLIDEADEEEVEAQPQDLQDQQEQIPEETTQQPQNLFGKFKRTKEVKNQEEVKRNKMQAALFSGVKNVAPQQKLNYYQEDPSAIQVAYDPNNVSLNVISRANPYLDEDQELVLEVSQECDSEPPESIQNFLSLGQPLEQCYSDPRIKCSCVCHSGTVLLEITNLQQSAMLQFEVEVTGPSIFTSEVVTHPQELQLLPPNKTCYFMKSFKFPTTMKGFPQMLFNCSVRFGENEVKFEIPMTLLSFIVPIEATTPQFGGFWKQGGCEIDYIIPVPDEVNLDDVSNVLNNMVHVRTVQRIGVEEIFMGGLYSTPFKVLMHAKVTPAKSDIKVLTKAQPLTQALVEELKDFFG